MMASYRVRLNNVEANFLQTIENTTMSCFFGLRYLRLDERFILTTVDGADASDYSVRALNELIGVHAGARNHWCFRGWNMLGNFSFGLYGNHCRQTTLATYDARQFIDRTFSPRRTGMAYTADFNFDAIHAIWNNVFLHVGYNLLYVGNVARAPDQLDFTTNSLSGSRVLWRDGALAHGPSLGIEARW